MPMVVTAAAPPATRSGGASCPVRRSWRARTRRIRPPGTCGSSVLLAGQRARVRLACAAALCCPACCRPGRRRCPVGCPVVRLAQRKIRPAGNSVPAQRAGRSIS